MNTLERISSHHARVRQDVVPVLPIHSLPVFGRHLESLAETLSVSCYDEFGMDIEGEARLFDDDIDFPPALIDVASDILGFDFDVETTHQIPDDTLKALNAHHVTALNLARDDLPPGAKILDICTGNGEVIPRLIRNGITNASRIDLVGASCLNTRASVALRMIGAKVNITESFLHDVPDEFFCDQYDLIICHHGLHHVLRTREGERAFVKLLGRLAPGGKFIGDKIDMMGLDTMQNFSFKPSHSLELLGVDRTKYIEGSNTIRIGGKVWEDAILSDDRLIALLAKHGYIVHIMPGRGAFAGFDLSMRPFTPPPSVASAARRAEAKPMTHIEIRKYFPFIPPAVDCSYDVAWEPVKSLPPHAQQYVEFPIVKGTHFQVGDIPYIGDATENLYSEKTNGTSASVCISVGCAYAVIHTTPPQYMIARVNYPIGAPILRIQCEFVSGQFIVLDPIHLGVNTPSGFGARIQYLTSILVHSPNVASLIHMKRWHLVPDPEWAEGVVMMGVSDPSPIFNKRYRNVARYIKREPTIDVALPGKEGVWEVTLAGKVLRQRSDKSKPNSERNIAHVRSAIPHSDFFNIFSIRYDQELEYEGLLAYGRNEKHGGILVALRFPNRPNPYDTLGLKASLISSIGAAVPFIRPTYEPGIPEDTVVDIGDVESDLNGTHGEHTCGDDVVPTTVWVPRGRESGGSECHCMCLEHSDSPSYANLQFLLGSGPTRDDVIVRVDASEYYPCDQFHDMFCGSNENVGFEDLLAPVDPPNVPGFKTATVGLMRASDPEPAGQYFPATSFHEGLLAWADIPGTENSQFLVVRFQSGVTMYELTALAICIQDLYGSGWAPETTRTIQFWFQR